MSSVLTTLSSETPVSHSTLPAAFAGCVVERRARVMVRRDRTEHPDRRGVGDQRIGELRELIPALRLGRHHRHGQVLRRQRRPEKIAHERDQLAWACRGRCPRSPCSSARSARRARPAGCPRRPSSSRSVASLFAQSWRFASSSEPPLSSSVVLPFAGRRPGRAPHLRAARDRLLRGGELGGGPVGLDLHAQQRKADPGVEREELVRERVGDVVRGPRARRAEAVDALIGAASDRPRRVRPAARGVQSGRAPEPKHPAAAPAATASARACRR